MRTRIIFRWLTITSLILPLHLCAQERMIRGMVTTFDRLPLISATVRALRTNQEVLTDSLGIFLIRCQNNDKLIISADGFYDQQVKLSAKIKFVAINLKLKPVEQGRTYAIGYGHVSEEGKLNAATNLNKEDMNFSKYNDIYELIRGRCAGVQVIDNKYIIIRGINSINSRENSALVLVDGRPCNADALKSIAPAQIKSIDVIKDAGASIYGTRGANGVILIETNR